jgi:hypothetical protein
MDNGKSSKHSIANKELSVRDIWKFLAESLQINHLLSKHNVIPTYCPCDECKYWDKEMEATR